MILDVGDTRRRATRYRNVSYRGDVLYYRVCNHAGRWVEIRYGSGTPKDAEDARHLRQQQEDRVRNGLDDPRELRAAESARQPLEQPMAEYRSRLESKGDSRPHILEVMRMLNRWRLECNVDCLRDADAARLDRWLADMDVSARTRNGYRSAVLGFVRWAVDYGRLPFDPMPGRLIHRADEDADRRRLSRAMTRAEFDALMDAVPLRRQAFYAVAALTGLRWREIARLRWSALDGDLLNVAAGQTKNRKRAELPVIDELMAVLGAYRAEHGGDRMFDAEPRIRTWRHDLVRAGIVGVKDDTLPANQRYNVPNLTSYVDDRGRQLDRKSLRMTFATWLKDAGVDLRDAQRLMRHSDVNLTAKIYTDVRLPNLRAAAEKISGTRPRGLPKHESMVG